MDRHSPSATPAHDQPLQEGATFAGRTLVILASAAGLSPECQLALVLLKSLPGDVPFVNIFHQEQPFLPRHLDATNPAIGSSDLTRLTVRKCPGIPWIMEYVPDQRGGRGLPHRLLVGATMRVARKQQAFFSKMGHHAPGRADAAIGFKQKVDGLLYLLIRIEDDLAFVVVDETDREVEMQLSSLCRNTSAV